MNWKKTKTITVDEHKFTLVELSLANFKEIEKAKDDDSMVAALMISLSVTEPAIKADEVAADMPIALVKKLVEEIKTFNGIAETTEPKKN